MPVGAAWKPEALTAPVASQFIDVLAQTCGNRNEGNAQAISRSVMMPPRAWRPGFEPAELLFCVPHFFHQQRKAAPSLEKERAQSVERPNRRKWRNLALYRGPPRGVSAPLSFLG